MNRNMPSQGRHRSVSLIASSTNDSAHQRSKSVSNRRAQNEQRQHQKNDSRRSRTQSCSRPNGTATSISAPVMSMDGLTSDCRKSTDGISDDGSLSSDIELDPLVGENNVADDEEVGLAKKERKKRQWRKRRNTRLDERVVTITHASKDEDQIADTAVVKRSLINVVLIGLW